MYFYSCRVIFFISLQIKKKSVLQRAYRNDIWICMCFSTHLAEIRETTDLRHLTGFIRRAAVCPNEPTGQ